MGSDQEEDKEGDKEEDESARNGIYRPPKLAPVPYTEPSKSKEKDRTRKGPVPGALTSLAHLDPSMPHMESTSGLGSTPALMSRRAKELERMTEFEEENFTRLVMKKKDMKRRKQDEADLALGGSGMSGRHGRGGGLEDEFGDVLRSVGRNRGGIVGDGYEELRQKGKKATVLERSRVRGRDDLVDGDEGLKQRKRSRFEKEVKASKRRASAKSSRRLSH
jgi:U3 small nucleolar ribonucleoprotein protein LCP5